MSISTESTIHTVGNNSNRELNDDLSTLGSPDSSAERELPCTHEGTTTFSSQGRSSPESVTSHSNKQFSLPTTSYSSHDYIAPDSSYTEKWHSDSCSSQTILSTHDQYTMSDWHSEESSHSIDQQGSHSYRKESQANSNSQPESYSQASFESECSPPQTNNLDSFSSYSLSFDGTQSELPSSGETPSTGSSQSVAYRTDKTAASETQYSYTSSDSQKPMTEESLSYSSDFTHDSEHDQLTQAQNGFVMARLNSLKTNSAPRTTQQSGPSGNKATRVLYGQEVKRARRAYGFIEKALETLAKPPAPPLSPDVIRKQHSSHYKKIPVDHCFAVRAEKLRIENLIGDMKKKCDDMEQDIHEQTEKDRDDQANDIIRQFTQIRRVRLQRNLMEDRIADHQARMNSVALIGNLAESLPKPTDSPQEIWDRLMNTASRHIADD